MEQSTHLLSLSRRLKELVYSSRQRKRDFVSFRRTSKVALGPIQALIQWIPWSHSPETRRPVREVDHSHPSSDEVKNEWSHNPSSPTCLRGLDRDNFTFTLCEFNCKVSSYKKTTTTTGLLCVTVIFSTLQIKKFEVLLS